MNNEIAKKPHVAAIVKGSHKFGTGLLSRVIKQEENVVFSGYSISNVLSMTALGAKENTLKQMKEVLSLPEEIETLKSAYYDITTNTKSDDKMTLETANCIFPSHQLEISEAFIKNAQKYFGSNAQTLDYSKNEESREVINDWVSKNTNEQIKELFGPDSIEKDTMSVLVNTIYFKGDWLSKFDPANTTEKDFHVTPEKIVKVPTMFSPKMRFAKSFNEDLKSTIIALPYEGERISMYFFIPKEPFGLHDLELKLASDDFDPSILDKVTNYTHSLVQLPKFKIESFHDLGAACISLGITDLFDQQCDLSGLAGEPGQLLVSKIAQKAVIEVNEEGSEVSASSGIMIMVRLALFSDPLVIDHPFAFMIKDKLTGLVLFSGRVVDPSQ